MSDPLFVANLATLKLKLRLTNTPSSSADTLAILDESILKARLTFNRRLGTQRVANLVAITEIANPQTEDEILRSLASVVETKLVYVELLRKLPNTFMDASGDVNKRWNEEAPIRERGQTNLEREIKRLLDEIEQDMEMLNEEEALADEASFHVFDGTPTSTPPRPGDSIRLNRRRCGRQIFED